MRGILIAFAGIALLFMGCAAPQPVLYNCCKYDNASGDGTCVTANGTVYETNSCSVLNMTCEVVSGESHMASMVGGREIRIPIEVTETLPICPRSELLQCNSSCVGMFCGSFEFDPRPPIGMDVEDLDKKKDKNPKDVDASQYGGMDRGGAMGLYKGECRILDMAPATIRAAGNTNGGFALNSFRFGVGSSFAEFDEAVMYYPLTDFGCGANPSGTKDRYVNYMIPNLGPGGAGELCREEGMFLSPWGDEYKRYTCTLDETIRSYSYQDCAIRCSLHYYGDVPAVDPYGAYPTERNGVIAGSPFAYGGPGQGYSIREVSAIHYNWEKEFKRYVGYRSFGAIADEYPLGYNYYGAEFEKNAYPMSDFRGYIDQIIIARGRPATSEKEIMDYYGGEEADLVIAKWIGADSSDDVIANLMTVERDPHMLYSYMLSHHSVYAKQFREGHYDEEGRWAPGAEFECTLEGMDCLSGYCNTWDYKRGACITTEGGEVQCDCHYDYLQATVVCDGRLPYEARAFDNPGKRINVSATLGSIVKTVSGGGVRSMPSKGKTFNWNPDEMYSELFDRYGGSPGDTNRQMLVMLLGGEQTPDFNAFEYREGIDDTRQALTIWQVLSREKWAGCSEYHDCGKFYTTFVQACMPSFPDEAYAGHMFAVCYRVPIGGIIGQTIDPATGRITNHTEGSSMRGICHAVLSDEERSTESYGGVDKNEKTNYDQFCYSRDSEGECVGVANAALVIMSRSVTYEVNGDVREGLAFGNCLLENEELKIKEYGYCEQCSYLTMAKETVVPLPEDKANPGYEGRENRKDNKYCPSLLVKSIIPPSQKEYLVLSYGGQFGEWESGGVHRAEEKFGEYSECEMPDGSEVGRQDAWPDYLPDAYYLKTKLQDYMQRNVMPILFADDEGLYRIETSDGRDMLKVVVGGGGSVDDGKTTHPYLANVAEKRVSLLEKAFRTGDGGYGTVGTYLADSVRNLGAGIIVVRNLEAGDMGSYGGSPGWRKIDAYLHLRGNAVGLLCPNCMVAVSAGYGAEGASHLTKMAHVSQMFDYRDPGGAPLWDDYSANLSCINGEAACSPMHSDILEKVDVIATKWELGTHNSHCGIDDEKERFEAILADEMEFGSKMLRRFGKPTVVTDFSIRRNAPGSCWDEGSATRFMSFLGERADDLVRSGHIGIIYGDWTYAHSGSAGTKYIRTAESGVSGYRSEFFGGTLAAARGFSGFGKLTSIAEVVVAENCECVPCSAGDPAEICTGRFGGTGPVCDTSRSGTVMVKWPETCITENVCMPPGEMSTYRMVCDFEIGGEKTTISIDGAEVEANPGLYKQMIASLGESSQLPCFSGKSYRRQEIAMFTSYPILYRDDGNLSYSCNPLSIAQGELCGPVPQLDLGKMECRLQTKFADGVPGGVPEPGGGPFPFGTG